MIERIFKEELARVTSDHPVIDKLWLEIRTNYSKSNRYYHNLLHLDSVANELLPVKDQILDWQTIVFSLAYHDVIYKVPGKDNKEKSAALAFDRLTEAGISLEQRMKCKLQILATKSHQASDEPDTNYFTDSDLSILGAAHDHYLTYTELIRKEYKLYPDIIYKPGRRNVLNHFLQMKKIFKTEYFYDRYEKQAKLNLSEELQQLL